MTSVGVGTAASRAAQPALTHAPSSVVTYHLEMRIDRGVLLSMFFLVGLGLVQVYSTSYIFATEVHGDGLFFFRKQMLFAVLGLVALVTTSTMSWERSYRFGLILWVLAGLGCVATFIPHVGVKVGGAHRWLNLPFGFRLEPGELLRVTYPFILAPIVADYAAEKIDRVWFGRSALALLPMGVLYLQPDFGSFVIVSALIFCLFLAFGLRWRLIFGATAVAIPTLAIMIMTSPYRRLRVEAFMNPWADPAEKGFQVIQSMLSFYSGGFTGVGLGEGQGKLFFLPEAHTDFTLAVLGEEMGFVGFVLLLAVFGFLVFRAFQTALHLKLRKERAIALAIGLLITFSVFINVGVALGLLPTKGLTLPLISYGGSSLVCTGLMIGWLLNLERVAEQPVAAKLREVD